MTERSYEVVGWIGPCSYAEAETFLSRICECFGDHTDLAAKWSLQAHEEQEQGDQATVQEELLDALEEIHA